MALNTVTHIVQGFHGSKHFMHDVLRFALWTYSWKKRKKDWAENTKRVNINAYITPATPHHNTVRSSILHCPFLCFYFWAVCWWLSVTAYISIWTDLRHHSLTNCSVACFSATWFSCFVCWWRLATISHRCANTHQSRKTASPENCTKVLLSFQGWHTQTSRLTDTVTGLTDRQAGRLKYIQTDTQTDGHTDQHTYWQTDTQTCRLTDTHTGRLTYIQTERHTGRLTDKLTHRQTEWHTDSHGCTNTPKQKDSKERCA